MSTEATNRQAAVALAEALGNLPLALEQAAAYTAQTGISLADYLELFRERAARYTPPATPSADYPAALAVTFELAFTKIREDSPAAADLLTLCAFLAPDDVPLESFKEGVKKERAEAAPPESLAYAVANPEALAAAAATLQAYAFVKVRGGSFLSMHRLIQAVARDRLGDDERKKSAEVAVTLIHAAFRYNPRDTRTWPPSARLLQHALIVAEHARTLGVVVKLTSILLNNLGAYLFNNAELVEAQAALEKSVALREELLGPTHPELAASLDNIGQTLIRQGKLDEAAEYLKRALAMDEEALGPDHPNVAVRLNNIGEVLRERGAYDDARRHYERALAIFEALPGPTHEDIPTILNNIGLTLHAQDDLKSARTYYERALLIDEASDPNHPNVAIDLNNLGSALAILGDVDTARQHLERALRICLEHLGKKHPLTLTVKRHLGELGRRAAGGSSSEESATAAAEVENPEDEDAAE
ncbi:MAG TPA: tetratricopeptide repeat protein [Pyrinomonadaceae bacterium]|jgi:Tfp pilus assembly protein PilF|nr:tetratricopeptide repeat protein [Pyrinomonadaceae bacterium]